MNSEMAPRISLGAYFREMPAGKCRGGGGGGLFNFDTEKVGGYLI